MGEGGRQRLLEAVYAAVHMVSTWVGGCGKGASHSTDPSPAPHHSTINYSKELPLAQGIKFE